MDGAESLLAQQREPSHYEECRLRVEKAYGLPLQVIFTPLGMAGACVKATLSSVNTSGLPKPQDC